MQCFQQRRPSDSEAWLGYRIREKTPSPRHQKPCKKCSFRWQYPHFSLISPTQKICIRIANITSFVGKWGRIFAL